MKEVINFIKKNNIYIIFISFFILVLFQHQYLFMYFDDYGYASLNSYNMSLFTNSNYNFIDIIKFLISHYVNWGGRILFFLIEILLLKSGIIVFRLVQSSVITLIFIFIYLLLKKHMKTDNWKVALFSVSLYGFISILIFRDGIFWITASVLYLFPLLFFLAFIYFYDKYKDNNKILFYIISGILIFFAAFSQEQISSATLFYIIVYTIYNYINTKKIDKNDIMMCVIAIIGFLILMISPGNQARMGLGSNLEFYNLSLFSKISHNIPRIMSVNFTSYYNKIFTILFFTSMSYISYKNIKNKRNIISKLSLVSNILIVISTIIFNGYFDILLNYDGSNTIKRILLIVLLLQILLVIYDVSIYLFKRKNITTLMLFYSAIVSQAIMLYSPSFPDRAVIPFEMLIFVLITMIFYDILKEIKYTSYIIIPVLIISIVNYSSITLGYYSNSSVNISNNKVLLDYSKRIKSGEKIEKIILKKMPNELYSSMQPLTEEYDFVLDWMKVYYDIPLDIEIVYE